MRDEDIARQQTRGLLLGLRDALDQPPLSARVHLILDRILELLAEQDIGKRVAARDRLDAILAELDAG